MEKINLIQGIRISSYKQDHKNRLVLIEASEKSNLFAVFTKNILAAAPVIVAKENLNSKALQSKQQKKALIINTGNANVGNGKAGLQVAYQTCDLIAKHLETSNQSVLPFSTGVIASPLAIDLFRDSANALVTSLESSESAWHKAAKNILTTDTREKIISIKKNIAAKEVTITAIAKGSGMICPNMATMLAFIATDAKIEKDQLNQLFQQTIDKTFNRISVDGDTSTNDAVVLIATNEVAITAEQINQFKSMLFDVCHALAKMIIEDGEGATKLISIEVKNASNQPLARQVAYDIAHSPLVKTAFFAQDANWGRILAAIGKPDIVSKKAKAIDINQVDLYLNQYPLFIQGEIATGFSEERASEIMLEKNITIEVNLNQGSACEQIYTTDLSLDYVRINSDYRS